MKKGTRKSKKRFFLRPKTYGIEFFSRKTKVARKSVNEPIPFENFKAALAGENLHTFKPSSRSIRAFGFDLYCVSIEKGGFAPLDVKRYWISKHESLPYGHLSLRNGSQNRRKLDDTQSSHIPLKKRRIE